MHDTIRMLERLTEKVERACTIQSNIDSADWAELHELSRQARAVIADARHMPATGVPAALSGNSLLDVAQACRDFFATGDDADSVAMVERIDAALTAHRKPLVYVTVTGGVAEIEVEEPGTALVLLYDFDNASQDEEYPPEPTTWAERRVRAEAIEAEG